MSSSIGRWTIIKDDTGKTRAKRGRCMDQNKTLAYYDQNAAAFAASTEQVAFSEIQDQFLALLSPGAKILDFGCGSGRDTRYFLDRGYSVDTTDGSEEMCRYAGKYTGIPVRKMLFSELDAADVYDGIWACSSILHVCLPELPDVFEKMVRALKKHGIIYTSFKYGTYAGMRNGRYFTDFTEESFEKFLSGISNLRIRQTWVSSDVRPGRADEKWLNVILEKMEEE